MNSEFGSLTTGADFEWSTPREPKQRRKQGAWGEQESAATSSLTRAQPGEQQSTATSWLTRAQQVASDLERSLIGLDAALLDDYGVLIDADSRAGLHRFVREYNTAKPSVGAEPTGHLIATWRAGQACLSLRERLLPEGDHDAKLARIRDFYANPPDDIDPKPLKLTVSMTLAVVPARAIHEAQLADVGTTLSCVAHARSAAADPHAGIHPDPGADHWPASADAPAHLAVQQHLYMSICHMAPAKFAQA